MMIKDKLSSLINGPKIKHFFPKAIQLRIHNENEGKKHIYPNINYENHPYYGALNPDFIKAYNMPSIQIHNLNKFYLILMAIINTRSRQMKLLESFKPDLVPSDITKCSDELTYEGITKIVLKTKDLDLLKNLVNPYIQTLDEKLKDRPSEKRAVESVAEMILTKKLREHANFFDEMLTRYNIFSLCKNHKGLNYYVRHVVLQKSKSTDTGIKKVCSFDDGKSADTYYMHIDSKPDSMKILLYMNDTYKDTGSFRYIKGAHLRTSINELSIREANDQCKWENPHDIEDRLSFFSLPKEYRKKANFGNDLLSELYPSESRELIEKESYIEGEAGSMVLFDPDGIHRGSIFKKKSQRTILQILLMPKPGK